MLDRWSRVAALAAAAQLVACSNRTADEPAPTLDTSIDTLGDGGSTGGLDDDDDDDGLDDAIVDDFPNDGPIGCAGDGVCPNKLDMLFVINNSGTMGEEQANLALQYGNLIDKLQDLRNAEGELLRADVNIMVTTTDMWNPACNGPWVKEDYEPAAGDPIFTTCRTRPGRFESHEDDNFLHTCTDVCTTDAVPADPFIHFDADGHNVQGGTPADALSCIGPQGVDGCGYESPLESMIQALRPDACWNNPDGCSDDDWTWVSEPFLRDGAALAIVMLTDEADCSMKNFAAMESNAFIEGDSATSAICWNAGVKCTDIDPSGEVYGECHAVDRTLDGSEVPGPDFPADAPALQPLSRYIDFLDSLRRDGKDVVMLGILGVPEVRAHNPDPPFQPLAGGVFDLEYRNWRPDDILPGDPDTVEVKQDKFGIGPGCTGFDATGDASTGQAIPPVRVKEVCESLNDADTVRCCIESICDDDFSAAINCLTGVIQQELVPAG